MKVFVLQTIGGKLPTGETSGGVRHWISLARQWTELGHEVYFVTNSFDTGSSEYSGISHLFRVPSSDLIALNTPVASVLESFTNYRIQRRAIRQIASNELKDGSDARILCTTPSPSDVLMAFELSRRFHVKAVVYFAHLAPPPWWFPFRRGGLMRASVNWMLWTFSLAVTKVAGFIPSVNQLSILQHSWMRFDNMVRDEIALPTPCDPVPEAIRNLDACFVARLAPSKGVTDLLKCWNTVLTLLPDAKLVLAGYSYSGRFSKEISRLLRRLDLNKNVRVLGAMADDQKIELLRRSKLFVHPSYEEGWSLGVMEAALHGAVPVVYDLPAYNYLGRGAVRVRTGDWKALGSKIVELLQDDRVRESVSREARAAVLEYQPERVAAEYMRSILNPVRIPRRHPDRKQRPPRRRGRISG